MLKKIHLNLESTQKIMETSNAIYFSGGLQSQILPHEAFINLTIDYDQQIFEDNSQLWYLLFNGKQIRQPLLSKKTVMAIQKGAYQKIYQEISIIKSFEINHQIYNLKSVNNIVLCDLTFAKGGIFDVNEIHSAFFIPYFLDQPIEGFKLTFIFINLLVTRFKGIASKVILSLGYKIILNGNILNLGSFTTYDFARWLLLHEYIHNSGPLPLFAQHVNKFTKKRYGCIEELRVDLTTIKIIIENVRSGLLSSEFYNVVAIIVIERIFRAALYNFKNDWPLDKGMFAKEVEGDTAIALMIMLANYDIFDIPKKTLNLDINKILQIADLILSDFYKYELTAKEQNKFNSTCNIFSNFIRKKYFKMSDLVYEFLATNSVQNCKFYLNFVSKNE